MIVQTTFDSSCEIFPSLLVTFPDKKCSSNHIKKQRPRGKLQPLS